MDYIDSNPNFCEMHCFSDLNKGGDPIWYYNSQALKPDVQEKFKEMQIIPFDNPP